MTKLGVVKTGKKIDSRKLVKTEKPKPEINKTLNLLLGSMRNG